MIEKWSFSESKMALDREKVSWLVKLDRIFWFSYLGSIFISVLLNIAIVDVFELNSFWARFGAMLIFVSTALSGFALHWVISQMSYFEDRDRRWKAAGLSRLVHLEMLKKEQNGKLAWKQHLRAESGIKRSNKLLRKILFFETAMLSIGTLFWGFGDIIDFEKVCSC